MLSDYSYKGSHLNAESNNKIEYRIINEKDNFYLLTKLPITKGGETEANSLLFLISTFNLCDQTKTISKIISHQKKVEYSGLYQKLSSKEKTILKGIGEGLEVKEIAEKLNISYNTVVTHRKRLFKKLNTSKSAQLAVWAERFGLL